MEETFWPVYEVGDYYDRPLSGVAVFRGIPHRFCQIGWIPIPADPGPGRHAWAQEMIRSPRLGVDHYKLIRVDDESSDPVWVRADFRGTISGVELPPGGASSLSVCWRPITVQERIDNIFRSQQWCGSGYGMPEGAPFLVMGLYLGDADLDAIRPELLPRDPRLVDLGEIGRYHAVPVYHRASPQAASCELKGSYLGVGFGYIPWPD